MIIISPVIDIRIVFILGVVNFITVALILVSCRCLPTSKMGKNLMQNATYKHFYKYHCYLWWIFLPSVIIHIIFAISNSGIPF
jgi:hypothetical protein